MLELIPYSDFLNVNEIFSASNLFIIGVAIFWLIIASIQDFKRREVENWWSFSLVVFILAFRAFLSIEKGNYWYFAWGLIGFIAAILISNLFYYSRMYGGGDAKLLMALGTILPLSLSWQANLGILIIFLILFLFVGAIYGMVYSLVITLQNLGEFSEEFPKIFKKNKRMILFTVLAGVSLFIFSFFIKFYLLLWLSILLTLSPFLLVYAKAIENSCMINSTKVSNLTIGDLLARPLRIGKITIKPNWEGLSERELKFIKRKLKPSDKVKVKQGIPFVPVFLIAFIIMLWLINNS